MKRIQLKVLLTLFLTAWASVHAEKPIKLLVLIITSDQLPVYRELQKIWKSYMHLDPDHVEAYFIRGDENLSTSYAVKDDVIWSKTKEGWIVTSSGIIDKTVISLQAMQSRFADFDYILRTNLSSFYVFPKLLEFLKTLPKNNCYCGSPCGDSTFIASGCGFIMSPDVANVIINNKNELLGKTSSEDDVLIGFFCRRHNIPLIKHKRVDFLTLQDWHSKNNSIANDIFHFRIKNLNNDLRLTDDIYIHAKLLKRYYGINFPTRDFLHAYFISRQYVRNLLTYSTIDDSSQYIY